MKLFEELSFPVSTTIRNKANNFSTRTGEMHGRSDDLLWRDGAYSTARSAGRKSRRPKESCKACKGKPRTFGSSSSADGVR